MAQSLQSGNHREHIAPLPGKCIPRRKALLLFVLAVGICAPGAVVGAEKTVAQEGVGTAPLIDGNEAASIDKATRAAVMDALRNGYRCPPGPHGETYCIDPAIEVSFGFLQSFEVISVVKKDKTVVCRVRAEVLRPHPEVCFRRIDTCTFRVHLVVAKIPTRSALRELQLLLRQVPGISSFDVNEYAKGTAKFHLTIESGEADGRVAANAAVAEWLRSQRLLLVNSDDGGTISASWSDRASAPLNGRKTTRPASPGAP